jgi:hypothetical protein
LSDLSWASSSSFAIAARFPCIVVIPDISRLFDAKFRSGCSTSFSIRCDSVACEDAIVSVELMILFHAASKILNQGQLFVTQTQLKEPYPRSPPTSCKGFLESFLRPATYASSTFRRSCKLVNGLPLYASIRRHVPEASLQSRN